MKKYQQKQMNEFGQEVGISVKQGEANYFKFNDLSGVNVNLRCLNAQPISVFELAQIWQVVNTEPDPRCWTYLPYDAFDSENNLKIKLDQLFGFEGSIHYLIEVGQTIVGWVAFLNVRSQSQVVEIGNVYFSHLMKQSTAATEAIFLLLSESFKRGFRRVEWKCDDLNQPSKRAALRYGFQFEGVFRQDRMTKGRNRNTAWFSMLDEEWLDLEKAYQAWLQKANFDENAQQKLKLSDFMHLYIK